MKIGTIAHSEDGNKSWKGIYRVSAIASVIMLLLIPIQIIVFISWPPPSTVEGFFSLFQSNSFLGLLSLDLLYIINNILLIFIYLGLFIALKSSNKSYMLMSLILGIIGIAAYFPSNPAFEMLSLSNQYFSAATDAERSTLVSSGHTMLAIYRGTSFNVYYILNAITLLIISRVMICSNTFSKFTAYTGILAGLLMVIPSTAGTIGLIFSLLSLIPWAIFTILIAVRFFHFGYHVN